MTGRHLRGRAVVVAALLGVALAGCKVDKNAFQERLFSCNPSAADPACDTDSR